MYLTTTRCELITVHPALISVTTYRVTEHIICAAALACVIYRGVDAVDIHHLTRGVRLKSGNVNPEMWSESMFDVNAPACVKIREPYCTSGGSRRQRKK